MGRHGMAHPGAGGAGGPEMPYGSVAAAVAVGPSGDPGACAAVVAVGDMVRHSLCASVCLARRMAAAAAYRGVGGMAAAACSVAHREGDSEEGREADHTRVDTEDTAGHADRHAVDRHRHTVAVGHLHPDSTRWVVRHNRDETQLERQGTNHPASACEAEVDGEETDERDEVEMELAPVSVMSVVFVFVIVPPPLE